MYKSFYQTNTLARLHKQNVLYVAYIGSYDGIDTFKYGKSSDVYQREYQSHRKSFKVFEMYNIYRTNYKDQVEGLLANELRLRNIHRELMIMTACNKLKLQTELFQPNEEYTINHVDTIIKELISEHNKRDREERELELERIKLQRLELEYKIKLLDSKIFCHKNIK